jgi:hypothetical protein
MISMLFCLSIFYRWRYSVRKNKVLMERGDTVLCNELSRYLSIIEGIGFEKVFELPFTSGRGEAETYFIYAHREGMVLSFDTYNTTQMNGGHLYYNWRPNSMTDGTAINARQVVGLLITIPIQYGAAITMHVKHCSAKSNG